MLQVRAVDASEQVAAPVGHAEHEVPLLKYPMLQVRAVDASEQVAAPVGHVRQEVPLR
jgi:formate-dependent phosphoribosylglycinamide formyltransferase (GAR transformylase)